ncbi:hypothetical protein FRC01_007918, partial [Tulasnella sp. 417]
MPLAIPAVPLHNRNAYNLGQPQYALSMHSQVKTLLPSSLPLHLLGRFGRLNDVSGMPFELNNDLFRRMLKPVEQVLLDSGMKNEDIDDVVLVSGSTTNQPTPLSPSRLTSARRSPTPSLLFPPASTRLSVGPPRTLVPSPVSPSSVSSTTNPPPQPSATVSTRSTLPPTMP